MTTQFKAFTIRKIERDAFLRSTEGEEEKVIQAPRAPLRPEITLPHVFTLPKKNVWR